MGRGGSGVFALGAFSLQMNGEIPGAITEGFGSLPVQTQCPHVKLKKRIRGCRRMLGFIQKGCISPVDLVVGKMRLLFNGKKMKELVRRDPRGLLIEPMLGITQAGFQIGRFRVDAFDQPLEVA
jgi:hypothetical protein